MHVEKILLKKSVHTGKILETMKNDRKTSEMVIKHSPKRQQDKTAY